MADTPAALQLRLLETVVQVAAEKNSTLVLPFPVELLRFLEASTEGIRGVKQVANGLAQLQEAAHRTGDEPHDDAGDADAEHEDSDQHGP